MCDKYSHGSRQSINNCIQESINMAKIIEQMVVIKLSKLVKDQDKSVELIDADTVQSLEEVVQSLIATGTVVEVIADQAQS